MHATRTLLIAIPLTILALLAAGGAVQAETFIVNTVADHTDGACDPRNSNGRGSRDCTLREAIAEANIDQSPDLILFDIHQREANADGTWTIAVGATGAGPLPAITTPVSIQGSAAGCVPVIEIDGSSLAAPASGLVSTGSLTLQGVIMNDFPDYALELRPSAGMSSLRCSFIGTDRTGLLAEPNGHGVLIQGRLIEIGMAPGDAGSRQQGNVISGNLGHGIAIIGDLAIADVIQGNRIGAGSDGVTPLGNGGAGIYIQDAVNTLVGDPEASRGNTIIDNTLSGIEIFGGGLHHLLSNRVGEAEDGTPAGNGIGISVQAGRVEIGPDRSRGAQGGNVVAYNEAEGVLVHQPTEQPTVATIVGNSIHDNGGLGIDLALRGTGDGVTANDGVPDRDSGPNGLQNYPVLVEAGQGSTVVTGRLLTTPDTPFWLDFYANPFCDSSGHGEGEHFLGSRSVVTDATGKVDWFFDDLPDAPAGTQYITVTATRGELPFSTSEFSECAFLASTPPPPLPEWSTVLLTLTGVLALAGVALSRRRLA